MKFFRLFTVYVASFLCVAAVSSIMWFGALQASVFNVQTVKEWVSASHLPSTLLDALVPRANGSGSNLLSQATIAAALKTTFPPSYVDEQLNTILDSTYAWINGKTTTITFSLPINQKKDIAIAQLTTALETAIASLPNCTASNQPSTQNSDIVCKPRNLSTYDFAHALATQAVSSSGLLDQPITEKNFNNAFTSAAQSDQRMSNLLEQLPTYRRTTDQLLYIWLPVTAFVSFIGIYFATNDRLLDFIRLSRRGAVSFGLNTALGLLLMYTIYTVRVPATTSTDPTTILLPLLLQAAHGFGVQLALLSSAGLVIAAIAWILLHIVRTKQHQRAIAHPPFEQTPIPSVIQQG